MRAPHLVTHKDGHPCRAATPRGVRLDVYDDRLSAGRCPGTPRGGRSYFTLQIVFVSERALAGAQGAAQHINLEAEVGEGHEPGRRHSGNW